MNKGITEKIVKVFLANVDKEFNAKGIVLELRKRKIDTNQNSVRKILSRLHRDGIIEKTQKGFYKAKSTTKEDFELIKKEGLEDLVKYETKETPKLHRLFFTFNTKTILKTLEDAELIKNVKRDNGEGWVSNNDYKINIDLLKKLINPFSLDNLFQKYNVTHTTKKLKDGYQDDFTFGTSKHRKIKLQTYGTGSVNVIIACDKDPLSPSELLVVFLMLDVIFQSKYGYSFIKDLIDFFILGPIEFNRDNRTVEYVPKGEVVTVRMLEDWAFRYYTKDIDGDTIIREEYIFEGGKRPPIASQFITSLETALQGGVNVQYLIYNTKQLFDAVNVMREELDTIRNATEYNLAENRKLMREILEVKKKGGKRK